MSKIIKVNFKYKFRRNERLERLFELSDNYDKKKHHKVLKPLGPDCLNENEIRRHIELSFQYEHSKLIEGYKKNNDHIFSCEYCLDLFFGVSDKVAEEKLEQYLNSDQIIPD